MLKTANDLKKFTLNGLDGNIGQISDIMIDRKTWKVKYIDIHTFNWKNYREIALNPEQIVQADWNNGLLPVNITREEAENMPEPEIIKNKKDPRNNGNGLLKNEETVNNYRFKTADKKSGGIHDFIVEVENWRTPFIAVRIVSRRGMKYTLIPVEWIFQIDKRQKKIHSGLHMDIIEDAPEFKKRNLKSEGYIKKLQEHYGIPEDFF